VCSVDSGGLGNFSQGQLRENRRGLLAAPRRPPSAQPRARLFGREDRSPSNGSFPSMFGLLRRAEFVLPKGRPPVHSHHRWRPRGAPREIRAIIDAIMALRPGKILGGCRLLFAQHINAEVRNHSAEKVLEQGETGQVEKRDHRRAGRPTLTATECCVIRAEKFPAQFPPLAQQRGFARAPDLQLPARARRRIIVISSAAQAQRQRKQGVQVSRADRAFREKGLRSAQGFCSGTEFPVRGDLTSIFRPGASTWLVLIFCRAGEKGGRIEFTRNRSAKAPRGDSTWHPVERNPSSRHYRTAFQMGARITMRAPMGGPAPLRVHRMRGMGGRGWPGEERKGWLEMELRIIWDGARRRRGPRCMTRRSQFRLLCPSRKTQSSTPAGGKKEEGRSSTGRACHGERNGASGPNLSRDKVPRGPAALRANTGGLAVQGTLPTGRARDRQLPRLGDFYFIFLLCLCLFYYVAFCCCVFFCSRVKWPDEDFSLLWGGPNPMVAAGAFPTAPCSPVLRPAEEVLEVKRMVIRHLPGVSSTGEVNPRGAGRIGVAGPGAATGFVRSRLFKQFECSGVGPGRDF